MARARRFCGRYAILWLRYVGAKRVMKGEPDPIKAFPSWYQSGACIDLLADLRYQEKRALVTYRVCFDKTKQSAEFFNFPTAFRPPKSRTIYYFSDGLILAYMHRVMCGLCGRGCHEMGERVWSSLSRL